MIRKIWENVEQFQQKVAPKFEGKLVCRAGCDSCCRQDLSVFGVEAAVIEAHLPTLPVETQNRVRLRALRGESCAFLLDGMCAIYEVRPAICRTHGLPVWIEGRVDCCPMNFADGSLEQVARVDLLDVEKLNTVLAAVEMADVRATNRHSGRVLLSQLAAVEKSGDLG